MRNSTLSRLVLLGLASVSSVAFAASKMTGEIRFDARFTLNQEKADGNDVADQYEKNDNLYISRARLDFCGDVAKDWMYGLRLEYPELENTQIGLDPSITTAVAYVPFAANTPVITSIDAVVARAFVCWSGIEGINFKMGRIGTPEVTSDRLYYAPYIGKYPNDRAVGSVTNYSGDHPGFAVDGVAGPIGYTFGIWKQTDLRKLDVVAIDLGALGTEGTAAATADTLVVDAVDTDFFDSKSLRIGFGGRLSFAQEMKSGTSFGVGIGYNKAPLNMSIAGVVVGGVSDGSDLDAVAYGLATYKDLSNLGIDISAVFKSFQINLGYQSQDMKSDQSLTGGAAAGGAVDAAALNFAGADGKASAFWVELGYLVMGEGYKFCAKDAVISGVKLREKQAGFEITARYGTENRKNMLALLTPAGWTDYNTDNAGTTAAALATADVVTVTGHPTDTALVVTIDNTGTATVIDTGTSSDWFETKMTGYSVALNYYMAENAVLKLEYENRHNEFKRDGLTTDDWHDSLLDKNVGTLRLRADYSF